ncbi:MAG: sigma-70 family RNA polymerase sigma factor [Bacteroidia bacterium]|nr:sigma-70 family RNA polymerase sigma factor [Bacteroidia bacterium]
MRKTEGIASIYNSYVNDLYTYALYLGFEKEIIMDAIHDVFCKIAADEKALHDVSNVKFYLFRSLKNRLYDIYKSDRGHVNLHTIESQELPFNILVTVEDKFISKEEQQQIENQIAEMLNSLTERQREVVYLRYVQEYDYQQISQLLNISVHGCRKLLSKAMLNLREKYGSLILLFLLS